MDKEYVHGPPCSTAVHHLPHLDVILQMNHYNTEGVAGGCERVKQVNLEEMRSV